jgi:hypothetical protein
MMEYGPRRLEAENKASIREPSLEIYAQSGISVPFELPAPLVEAPREQRLYLNADSHLG